MRNDRSIIEGVMVVCRWWGRLVFSVGPREVRNFRMIERHYFKDQVRGGGINPCGPRARERDRPACRMVIAVLKVHRSPFCGRPSVVFRG
jgi:hypothetical protein